MLINDSEIIEYLRRAIRDVKQVLPQDEVTGLLKLLHEDNTLKTFLNALILEVAMPSISKGIDISKKRQSILTMPENIPVLVCDENKSESLAIVVPKAGKFFMVGNDDYQFDIVPTCWYDIPLFGPRENSEVMDVQDV